MKKFLAWAAKRQKAIAAFLIPLVPALFTAIPGNWKATIGLGGLSVIQGLVVHELTNAEGDTPTLA